ncbi:site-2 protease family protein [Roseofilum casamattae]|uniref:Site-2 protease family protein n=1 Tax=Roseofilum casamattae BLCC-M143 TaxID=3022442 RepID=A0ABT7BSZ3_9CYAN|nr:site-2 protease family protein [Roseofilum casamattae]MDJ1181912.1 site-2 protease family protein [Roseofilum casamattae BLCC-M143]
MISAVSDNSLTFLLLLVALGILVWGFQRARPYGKLGILAWLQSVVLMLPWFLFFGLFSFGIYLNLAGILFLLVVSAGVYIALGRQLRVSGRDELLRQQVAERLKQRQDVEEAFAAESPEAATPTSSIAEPFGIPEEELADIKSIFGLDTYFITETLPYQEGVVFKGNLRGDSDRTYEKLSEKLSEKVGDRYRLFFVMGPENKPIIIILPNTTDPSTLTAGRKVLAIALAIATIFTSLEAGGIFQGFDWANELERWPEAMPIAAGLWTILIAHELGHWWMANRYNIRLSWPFLLPTWQIGAFGAITRFESVLPNRSVLFDIAFAGPAVSGLLSLIFLIVGLSWSHPGSLFQLPSQFFQGSLLVGTLARGILGDVLQNSLVDVHPLTLIGWLGLVLSAINIMPAGQLDGGRIVQAIYGRKTVGITTVATLIVLGFASFVTPLALYWAIAILVLQRNLERPSLNEVAEPNDARAALALLALFLAIATLMPLTPSLAGRLGIG